MRFRFSFTPAAYLDRQLEDISIVLENSLYEQRYWLPYRQEVEIRRRTSWLDFPARGIIRGRWEIEGYDLNVPLPDGAVPGPGDRRAAAPAAGATPAGPRRSARRSPGWRRRSTARTWTRSGWRSSASPGRRALSGLPSRRLAAGIVSDLVHVNRVQGLTLGFGGVLGLRASRIQVRPSLAYGTSDHRVTGALTVAAGLGATQVTLGGSRRIRDLSDLPVIAPVVNSLLAQEGGKDYGDYVLLHTARAGPAASAERPNAPRALGGRRGEPVGRRPGNAGHRELPPEPARSAPGTYRVARLELERASGGIAVRRDLQGRLEPEGGEGPATTPAPRSRAVGSPPWPSTTSSPRVYLGAGTDGLPPHRSFAIGGRGTLVGEPFRAFGGREVALGAARVAVRGPGAGHPARLVRLDRAHA